MKRTKGNEMTLSYLAIAVAVLLTGGVTKADFTFGEPVNLGPPVNTGGGEGAPYVSADGLSLYFWSSHREGGYGGSDIWVSTRATTEDQWGEPVNLGPHVNREDENGEDWLPAISADGLELYFTSWQYDPASGYYSSGGICVTKRSTTTDPWGQATMLDLPVDGAGLAGGPSLSADGLELYFCSLNERESEATIYVAKREKTDAPWGVPISLGPVVNNWSCQVWPRISSDGLLLLFCDYWRCAFRPGGVGATDIWLTTRTTTEDDWSEPVNAGPPLNAPSGDYCGIISGDGSTIYFESSRGGGQGGLDLWQASVLPVVDLDQDEEVGMNDLLMMIQSWGTDERMCDIGPMPWGDGVVDEADLEVLMAYWGQEMYPPTGLIAHWKLDETDGLTAHDNLGNNDGTLMGAPVWQPESGTVDGALALDGVDDYVVINRIFNPSHGPFSVFAWIKGGEPGQGIVSQQWGANWLTADALDGSLMTGLGVTAEGNELYSETGIADGNWHRIGLTWDGSTRALYVDDILVAEDEQTSLASSYGRHYIGCGKNTAPESFFTGLIDDVRIYNRAVKP